MKKQHASGAVYPARAEQSTLGIHPGASTDKDGERWFGVSDALAESRRTDALRIIGTAHGPRLLELLRAS